MDDKSPRHGLKLLVIGLDGATWDVIKPMVARGKLPNLARLMKIGSHGDLQSTMPTCLGDFYDWRESGQAWYFWICQLQSSKLFTDRIGVCNSFSAGWTHHLRYP